MKLAIITDYLNVYGGAERLLESILKIFPQADIFTSIYDRSRFSPESPLRKAKVVSVFDGYSLFFERPKGVEKLFQKLVLDFARTIKSLVFRYPKHFTFLSPLFFERLDLAGFDVVISVGTIWGKGIKLDPTRQRHIFYCLTPPRFLYGYASETAKRNAWYFKPFVVLIDHFLRLWDFKAAQRPDEIVSISHEVQRRVKKFYRRDSVVIYPPTGFRGVTPFQGVTPIDPGGEYFLIVSRLAAYKGIEVAVEACNRLKLPLKIVGTGKEEGGLKRLSKAYPDSTVEFLGFRSDEELAELYKNCRAVIFPTPDEDFGLVPLEANAFGKAVIAHRSGGVLETQVEGQTAVFYEENTPASLAAVLENFDPSLFLTEVCRANAGRFNEEKFQGEFKSLVELK